MAPAVDSLHCTSGGSPLGWIELLIDRKEPLLPCRRRRFPDYLPYCVFYVLLRIGGSHHYHRYECPVDIIRPMSPPKALSPLTATLHLNWQTQPISDYNDINALRIYLGRTHYPYHIVDPQLVPHLPKDPHNPLFIFQSHFVAVLPCPRTLFRHDTSVKRPTSIIDYIAYFVKFQ